jgi:NAD-dependent SIR2 family protein deacetylase
MWESKARGFMSSRTAPISDQARRTARRVATLITKAEALLITAGAGMSLDSSAPADPATTQLQALFDGPGQTFRKMAQPHRFETNPGAVWAWYGHRQSMYRRTQPHAGYRILHSWAQAVPCGSFVVTSNIDGQFSKAGFTDWQIVERHGSAQHYQCSVPCNDDVWHVPEVPFALDPATGQVIGTLPRCPRCNAVARPNVLMYDDVKWVDTVRREQQRRYESWLGSVRGKRVVVIECGAGEGAASVRRVGERLLERSFVSLVRINPAATEADEPTFVMRAPALQAIELIHESLPSLFGGANAARPAPERRPPEPITGRIRIRLEPVTCVDLGRGLVTPFHGQKLGGDEDGAFLERYGEAQSGWVQVPSCGGLEAPGYTMTARVFSSPEYVAGGTEGAAIVFVQAPDGIAVMTFGIARRVGDAPFLWQLLYQTTDSPLAALDFPRVPWVARRPAAGLRNHQSILPYLAQFERTLVRSYLPYLAFIDATRRKEGGEP